MNSWAAEIPQVSTVRSVDFNRPVGWSRSMVGSTSFSGMCRGNGKEGSGVGASLRQRGTSSTFLDISSKKTKKDY